MKTRSVSTIHTVSSLLPILVCSSLHTKIRSNDLPMRPLGWLSPKEKLAAFFDSLTVQDI